MIKRTLFFVGVFALVLVSATALGDRLSGGTSGTQVAQAQAAWPKELTGWAWTDNVGWISFNCSNTGSCGTSNYKVYLQDSATDIHYFSGYAWSDSIGWISFNNAELLNCPDGCTSPWMNIVSGQVGGSMWAMSGVKAAPEGEWNGWVELSGTNHASPMGGGDGGVTFNPVTGAFTGYAYGSMFGWVNFNAGADVGGNVVCPSCGSNPCTGTVPPANSVNGGSSGGTPWTYVAPGTTLASCQWRCDVASGYQYSGGSCVRYSCTGSVPVSAPATYETSVVSPTNGSTAWHNVSAGSPLTNACEFSCVAGTTYNSGTNSCDTVVVGACTGNVPENATKCNVLDGVGARVLGKPGIPNGDSSGTAQCTNPDVVGVPPTYASCEYYCGLDALGSPLKKRNNKCLTGLEYIREN